MVGGAAERFWLLVSLCLKGVAGDWSVHLPSSPICALSGSSVVLPCSYDYPQSSNETKLSAQAGGEVLSEMWCLEDSRCVTPRYVFHSDGIFPDLSYQSRVEYLGRPGTKNCSLRISDLKKSDSGTYVFYIITSHPTQKMPEQRGVHLLVADNLNAVSVSANPSSDITEGRTLHLACCSPAATPQTHFKWYKSTSSSPKHTEQVWSISNITSEASGSYFCQIQTGDIVQNSTMLHIDVQYSPRSLSVVSPSVDVQDDIPVTLTCSSDANPPVRTYSWYTGAACLPTSDKSFYQARQTLAAKTGKAPMLSSTNITTKEPGLHCCVARNKHGSQTCSVTLTSSRALTPSESSGGRWVLIGVTIGVLLVVIATVAFLITRRRKSSRNQSYALTATTAS